MNKIFRVKWNSAQKRYDVTSELTKGKKKSSSGVMINAKKISVAFGLKLLTGLLMALGMPGQAADIDLDIFNSKDGGHIQSVTGSNKLTASGWGNISSGESASLGFMSFAEAYQKGLLRDNDGGKTLESMKDGNLATGQTIGYEYYDSDTGNTATFQGYDNGQLRMANLLNQQFSVSKAVGLDGQYVDRNLIQVTAGGNLDVTVGDKSAEDWYNDPNNRLKVFLKGSRGTSLTSSVFKVDAASSLNYDSKTVVHLGNFSNQAKGANEVIASFRNDFSGSFTSVIGAQTVDNIDDLKNYNSALIAAVQAGILKPSQYNAEFNKAFNTGPLKQVYLDEIIDENDAARQIISYGRVAYFLGVNGGEINIASDAVVQGFNTDVSIVRLESGGVLNNYGELGTFSNSSIGSKVVSANNGSVINNYGVIDAGTNADMANYIHNGSVATVASGDNEAIITTNAIVNNYGVINIAPNGSYKSNVGVMLNGNSEMINRGSINAVATLSSSPTYSGKFTVGVQLNNTSRLTNEGTMYLGRQAQRDTGSPSVDITSAAAGSSLVYMMQNGTFVNAGTGILTLGTLTQGGYGVFASGSGVTVQNNGTINVNGKAPGAGGAAPSQNVGILARLGANNIENTATGNIILDGINSVAMMATSVVTDTFNSMVKNAGAITVKQGVDPVTKTANYGLWAEGARAVAINSGVIDMQGDGAIGAHARSGGTVQIDGTGQINFGGKNQTGYYVLGSGSKVVDNSTSSQNVTTEGSTLYRIDGGASFDGSSNTSVIGASGKNSTALLVTSNGAASNLNSGDMTLAISGEGATGIKVMGSAQGVLSANTILSLSGDDSTAGIVDGSYSDIVGNTSGYRGPATLTSYATLDSTNATGANATGYIARIGGTLDHLGTIDFTTAGSTGVLVDGGTLNNGAAGSISVNGTAVNIQGADSKVTNAGTVEATGGTAAFLVGNNAHLDLSGSGIVKAGGTAHGVLLDTGAMGLSVKDATIDMQAGGSGNGIENRAEIAGIKLDNTTINVGDGTGVRTAATLADTNSGTINVEGTGTGIYFGHADGSATIGTLDTSGSRDLVINVNDAAGKGIVTNTSGDVKSGASVNVNDAAGDAALVVGGTTSKVEQSGVLTSKSLTSAVIDVDNGRLTSFINRGDIIANSAAQEAIKVTLGSNIDFTNATGGNIVGRVELSDGNNRVTLEGGSTATDILTGSGDDSYYLNNISADEAGLFTSLQAGSGSDTLNLNNSSLTVTDPAMLTGFEKISLSQASLLNLSSTLLPLGDTQNDGTGTGFTLHDSSTLKLSGTADTAFASHIAGTGTLATDLAGQAFDFTGNNAANTFTGTLALGNATFDLAGENTQALTTAALRADNGGIVTVGTGSQAIGGLAFDGGTVKFNTGTPGHLDITTTVAAQQMDLSGHGTVEISAGTVDNNPVLPPDRLSVLEQDDSGIEMQLASSTTPVIADGGNLVLKDQFGNIITDALTREVEQNGVQVANAIYDYRLTSGGSGDGLYVNYGLTRLDLQGQDADALSLNAAGKAGNAADLSARITGSGDLAVDGGNVSLSNTDNDYLGKTFIRSGSLSMLNDNVLGKTSELAMSAGAGFAMNGHGQTVGAVNTAAGSLIDLDGGDLTVSNGGTLDGDITGAGTLNLTAGLLNVHGANGSLTAVTKIASGAQALLNSAAGLGQGGIATYGILGFTRAAGNLVNTLSGSGDVALHDGSDIVLTGNNGDFAGRFALDSGTALSVTAADSLGTATVSNEGTLNILTSADWTLANSVSGSGSLNKNGGGIMTLTQDAASYNGTTAVNSGGLMLGTTGSAVTLASSQTDVAKDALFGGFGGTAGSLNNAGTFIVGDLTAPVTRALPTASTFNVGGGLNNSGNIRVGQVGSGIAGNNLNVAGDYHGDGGRIHFNTALGGDNSLTDHMTVNGNTSGTTAVSVSNAGGLGGKTINGIELIAVRGASEGEFTQDGRIVAGAYDYMLARGKGENAANWYLTSGQEGGGGDAEGPDPDKEKVVLITRPESGAYASNMAAANTLFNTRLQDRLGETHYVDALTGEQKVTSMWLRNVGGHTRSTDSTGQLHTQANRWVTQLGGDVAQWSSDGADRFHLGVMAGYANQHSSTRNNVSGHSAKGSIDGYSTGIYATWLQDNEEKTGAYVDSWAQYSWFNNTVAGDTLKTESYKSDGITASVEAGYTWKLGEKNDRESYYIQPKAQVTWMGVEMDNVNESNGTRVSGSGDGNIQTRLGVRAFIKGHNKVDEGKQRTFEPFVEANWIANTKNFGSTLNGVNVSQRGTKNIGELKVGVEGQINPNLNLWGNIGQQMGDKGYSDSSAMLGVKVNF
jgi:autotransporter family porin